MLESKNPLRRAINLPFSAWRACCEKSIPAPAFERFHNSRALVDIGQLGIFLRKVPLEFNGFGGYRLWDRRGRRGMVNT